jgi:hypothetical protein
VKYLLCFILSLMLAHSGNAHALSGMADIAIIDRDSGVVLSPTYYRGEYWVAGRPGARYAIEIRNLLGERLLAVTSVDGVNVLSGATAGWGQTGYVFGPRESYQITGWRKTGTQVAAFTFTDSPNSYAERTGRPANVGIIGVALYREQAQAVAEAPPMIGGRSTLQPEAPLAGMTGGSAQSLSSLREAAPMLRAPAPAADSTPAPKLGTGHGEREYSYVSHTQFLRMQEQPNEVIRIRYDSFDNLLAMGIIRRPRPTPPTINPFPASPAQQYVPDPPG